VARGHGYAEACTPRHAGSATQPVRRMGATRWLNLPRCRRRSLGQDNLFGWRAVGPLAARPSGSPQARRRRRCLAPSASVGGDEAHEGALRIASTLR